MLGIFLPAMLVDVSSFERIERPRPARLCFNNDVSWGMDLDICIATAFDPICRTGLY